MFCFRAHAASPHVLLECRANAQHAHTCNNALTLSSRSRFTQIEALHAELGAARGAQALAAHMALATARRARDAEYAVGKAVQREVMLGTRGLVPGRHVDRGVQTVGVCRFWVWALQPFRRFRVRALNTRYGRLVRGMDLVLGRAIGACDGA